VAGQPRWPVFNGPIWIVFKYTFGHDDLVVVLIDHIATIEDEFALLKFQIVLRSKAIETGLNVS